MNEWHICSIPRFFAESHSVLSYLSIPWIASSFGQTPWSIIGTWNVIIMPAYFSLNNYRSTIKAWSWPSPSFPRFRLSLAHSTLSIFFWLPQTGVRHYNRKSSQPKCKGIRVANIFHLSPKYLLSKKPISLILPRCIRHGLTRKQFIDIHSQWFSKPPIQEALNANWTGMNVFFTI